jgi:aconitate hydratase
MAIWANIPECAKTAFQRFDASFYDRPRASGGGIIVAGPNSGQGSSRESAAIVPLELGMRVIVARSFARIHRANLIAQGIAPLELPDDIQVSEGERWIFHDLRLAIERGDQVVSVERNGTPLTLASRFTTHERSLLCAGGALAAYRDSVASKAL